MNLDLSRKQQTKLDSRREINTFEVMSTIFSLKAHLKTKKEEDYHKAIRNLKHKKLI